MSYSVRPPFSWLWARGGQLSLQVCFVGGSGLQASLQHRIRHVWWARGNPGNSLPCPSSSPKRPRQPSFHLAEFFCMRGHQHTMKCNSISLRSSVKVIHPCSHHYNRTFHHNRKFPCAPPSHSFPPHPCLGLPWSVFCHHRFGFGSHSLAQSTALKVGWAHCLNI